jgi:hypothetical protein
LTEGTAPRLGAVSMALAIAALITLLPERYHIMPNWLGYLASAAMVIPMLVVTVRKRAGAWERTAEVAAVGTALFFNVCNLLIVSYDLVENPDKLQPAPLFYTSVGIWCGNVLIFTLLYWLLDSGGADERMRGTPKYRDFDFPSLDNEAPSPPGWQPGLVDYLFLAFTTSTAFSPTEAMPMTARAKLLMILQATIALITVVIVAARTINILR